MIYLVIKIPISFQHCDTVRGLEGRGGFQRFFSLMRFFGGKYLFWFNYALYSQLQVVRTFVQHCTTLFFYNKQLYNVQPNICIIHIFIGIVEACVTIIWGCLTFYMYCTANSRWCALLYNIVRRCFFTTNNCTLYNQIYVLYTFSWGLKLV